MSDAWKATTVLIVMVLLGVALSAFIVLAVTESLANVSKYSPPTIEEIGICDALSPGNQDDNDARLACFRELYDGNNVIWEVDNG